MAGLPINPLVHVTRGQLDQIGLSLAEWEGLSANDPEDATDHRDGTAPSHDRSPSPPPQHADGPSSRAPSSDSDDTIDYDIDVPVMALTPADLAALGRHFSAMMVRIDPFDGTGNVKDFLADISRYFEDTNKITDKEKINGFMAHLSGEARLWFRTQSHIDKFEDLKTAFQDRFGITTQQKHGLRTKIYACRQLPGEPFKSFVGRVQELARQIDMGETEIVSVTLSGARPELRPHLSMAQPDTISALLKLPIVADEALVTETNPQFEALNAAMTTQMEKLGNQIAEMGRNDQRRSSRPSYRRPNNGQQRRYQQPAQKYQQQQQTDGNRQKSPSQRSPSSNRTTPPNPCSKCGVQSCRGNPCPAWGKTCFKCGRPNHFSRRCRTKVFFQSP